jgi:hypothetical protein
MNRSLRILFMVGAVLFLIQGAMAQTYDLQFVLVNNDGVHFDVKVQIKANGSTFGLGTSNMIFTFNSADLTAPSVLSISNFSGGTYQDMTTTGTGGNSVSLNFELLSVNTGTTVATSWTDVATIRFTVVDAGGNANLAWSGISEIYKDDESTLLTAGTLFGLDTSPLPIQLASFTAAVQQGNGAVVLKWSTASETNNYGFEVQKSLDSSNVYESIANSFIAGHGTSVEAHSYSFSDADVKPGLWYYRLKQTDLDGAVHYSERIVASSVTGVNDRPLPTTFSLDQNYPNPFNPSTTVEFALPKDARVTLDVYNVLGQRVAALVDEVRQAGYHSVRFNAGQLASGLYIYRIVAGDVTMVKKMMLTK